jgi:hypothetical protein
MCITLFKWALWIILKCIYILEVYTTAVRAFGNVAYNTSLLLFDLVPRVGVAVFHRGRLVERFGTHLSVQPLFLSFLNSHHYSVGPSSATPRDEAGGQRYKLHPSIWFQRQYESLKRRSTSTRVHGGIFHKSIIFRVTQINWVSDLFVARIITNTVMKQLFIMAWNGKFRVQIRNMKLWKHQS